MATLNETNDRTRQISPADIGPEDVIVTWLLNRFRELSTESLRDVVLLMEMMTNPETLPEERDDIYSTVREILFPQLIGKIRTGLGDEVSETPARVRRRTEWVGTRIKERRKEKGLTQADLAERSGLQQPQVSRLEAGVHSPSFKTLSKIAKALGIDVGDLDPSH